MRSFTDGRHEFGQNFLVDRSVVRRIVSLVAAVPGPVLEIGAGDGALTVPLERLGRSLTAIEIDPRMTAPLAARTGRQTRVVTGDALTVAWPDDVATVVGNLPFHVTTALLRRVLEAPRWRRAVLLVQWEVARRRAGVGGATLMTAEWWPWFEFTLEGRVAASAFRPRPAVDGGLLRIDRRAGPLVPVARRTAYRPFVRAVFQGRGRGLREIVRGTVDADRRPDVDRWCDRAGVTRSTLPKHLDAAQWAELFAVARPAPPGCGRDRSGHGRSGRDRPGRDRSATGRGAR